MKVRRICPQCGKFGDFYSGSRQCGRCITSNLKKRERIQSARVDKIKENKIVKVDSKPPMETKDTTMRILWFYQYIKEYDFDNWLHLKFVETLKQYPGVALMAYGPGIHEGYPHLTTLPYDPKHTIDDIKKHFDFDVIIMNTKSRMFINYNPHNNTSDGEWLPKGYCMVDVPRIVIEEDYHYEKSDDWYRENRVDMILQRHWTQSHRQQTVPMKWFPFSVDTSVFTPGAHSRHNRICFAGSISRDVYKYRFNACEALKKAGLIDAFPNGKKTGEHYVKCLQDYVSHISCSSTYLLTPAKMFEIMASGSVLLTNENSDLKLLFPDGSYHTYNTKFNCNGVVAVARNIIHDNERREFTVKLAVEAIRNRHSHQVRIGELINIINSINSGA